MCSLSIEVSIKIFSVIKGVKEFSVPIGFDESVQVDLVVVGSVAVSEKGKNSLIFV